MINTNISQASTRLDSDLLRTFLQVSASGSFSEAAARIHRSQSAVSLQMKQLENILGQTLFERHGRGVRPTAVAERLQPVAAQVVGLLEHAVAEIASTGLRGTLRVGIPDEYAHSLLPNVIAEFARANPGVELVVRCHFSAGFPQALADGDLDVAVHALASPPASARVLKREKTFWVASRQHRVFAQDPLPIALFDRACWWRDIALQSLDEAGLTYREVFSSESISGIAAAVASGVAVGLLGEDSTDERFTKLGSQQGFPTTPDSYLVLQLREGVDSDLSRAMCLLIESSFAHYHS